MVEDDKEINLIERQQEILKLKKKMINNKLLIDNPDFGNDPNVKDDDVEFNKLTMTCTIQRRNLKDTSALDNEQLESLKKLRSQGLCRWFDNNEANAKSTDFSEEDLKHLEKLNDMKKKKLGKTAFNLMHSTINKW